MPRSISSLLPHHGARCGPISLLAKAKKGGKGGKGKGGKGGKKQSGFEWASTFELKPTESAALRELAEVTTTVYRSRTGKPLHSTVAVASDVPKALWTAPVCVLVLREGEAGTEPMCVYANQAAVESHGLNAGDGYKSLIDAPCAAWGLPTSLPGDGSTKYEGGYEKKIVVAGGGDTVTLRDAQRWLLEKMAVVDGKLVNEPIGLAYAWEAWELEDGTTCRPGGVREAPQLKPEEVGAAVEAQAAEVRRLKDDEGLANQDPAVKAAVEELLRLKALLPVEE